MQGFAFNPNPRRKEEIQQKVEGYNHNLKVNEEGERFVTDEIESRQPSLATIIEDRLQGIERRLNAMEDRLKDMGVRLKKIEKFCEKRLGQKYYESFEERISALEKSGKEERFMTEEEKRKVIEKYSPFIVLTEDKNNFWVREKSAVGITPVKSARKSSSVYDRLYMDYIMVDTHENGLISTERVYIEKEKDF